MGIRIGVGKKIGGVYVGASTDICSSGKKGGSNKNGGGSGCIIYLLYLVFWWFFLARWIYRKTKEQLATNPDKVWFKQTWGIALILIIFFPIGLFLMWKYASWHKYVKIGVSVLFGLILIYSLIFAKPVENNNDNINNSCVNDSSEPIQSVPIASEVYSSVDLLNAFDDEEKAESLIGEIVEVTGEVEDNPLDIKHEKITLETTQSNLDGSIYCEMSEFSDDYSNVKENDIAVVVGTIEKKFGHVYMVDCFYITEKSLAETEKAQAIPVPTTEPMAMDNYLTEVNWAALEGYAFAVEIEDYDGDIFKSGKYKFQPVSVSEGKTPIIWDIYVSTELKNTYEELLDSEYVGLVGGFEKESIVVDLEKGDYIYVKYTDMLGTPTGILEIKSIDE